MKWPYYRKEVNQINLNSFKFLSNLVECQSLLELNSPDILALYGTILDDSIDSGNFSVRSSSFNWKRFWHLHGLAAYVKEELPIALISRKLYRFLFVFGWLYFIQCLTSFPSIDHFLYPYAQFLMLFLLTQSMFSQSTHLLCLSLNIQTWWTLLISNDLTRMVNFTDPWL